MSDLVNIFRGVILDDPHALERIKNILGRALDVIGVPLARPLMPHDQEADRPRDRCKRALSLGFAYVPAYDLLGVPLEGRSFAPMLAALIDVVVEGGELLVDA